MIKWTSVRFEPSKYLYRLEKEVIITSTVNIVSSSPISTEINLDSGEISSRKAPSTGMIGHDSSEEIQSLFLFPLLLSLFFFFNLTISWP